MRSDLLHAKAAVDWAESNLPSLEDRLNAWLNENVSLAIEELPKDAPNNLVVAAEKEPLPIYFNVEVGAYINAIRSSLDILASSLARRHGIAEVIRVQFPVACSADKFARGKYIGDRFVKALPVQARAIVESVEPYKGGNKMLWFLHHLDIVRKHRRLLCVEPTPATFHASGWGLMEYFTPVATGFMRADGKVVLGVISKGVSLPRMRYTAHVAIEEPEIGRVSVARALHDFTVLANSIIGRFDD